MRIQGSELWAREFTLWEHLLGAVEIWGMWRILDRETLDEDILDVKLVLRRGHRLTKATLAQHPHRLSRGRSYTPGGATRH